eukprot:TRINITY_DN23208_c0_g1_i1.p1 TRINITY_DN23208_c0_g1~~TRINITY_DN23208_c0_g1_i1.p1  ORF type:complete len:666 (+),score=104.35 TRINITY_DN23208_c0_g1_i1:137-1999(+)
MTFQQGVVVSQAFAQAARQQDRMRVRRRGCGGGEAADETVLLQEYRAVWRTTQSIYIVGVCLAAENPWQTKVMVESALEALTRVSQLQSAQAVEKKRGVLTFLMEELLNKVPLGVGDAEAGKVLDVIVSGKGKLYSQPPPRGQKRPVKQARQYIPPAPDSSADQPTEPRQRAAPAGDSTSTSSQPPGHLKKLSDPFSFMDTPSPAKAAPAAASAAAAPAATDLSDLFVSASPSPAPAPAAPALSQLFGGGGPAAHEPAGTEGQGPASLSGLFGEDKAPAEKPAEKPAPPAGLDLDALFSGAPAAAPAVKQQPAVDESWVPPVQAGTPPPRQTPSPDGASRASPTVDGDRVGLAVLVREFVNSSIVGGRGKDWALYGDVLVTAQKALSTTPPGPDDPPRQCIEFFLHVGGAVNASDVDSSSQVATRVPGQPRTFRVQLWVGDERIGRQSPQLILRYKQKDVQAPPHPVLAKVEWESTMSAEQSAILESVRLEWAVNPGTRLTELGFLVDPASPLARAVTQTSSPPGRWSQQSGQLLWQVVEEGTIRMPAALNARFYVRPADVDLDAHRRDRRPVTCRFVGPRDGCLAGASLQFCHDASLQHRVKFAGGVQYQFASHKVYIR